MLLQVGPIRLALLDAGVKSKTLILPPPSRLGLDLDWEEDGTTVHLVEGGRRTRRIGYVPFLVAKWSVYDDTRATGIADGQTPSLEALLVLLSATTGQLRVSPGMTTGGFTVDQIVTKPIGKTAGFYSGVEATFYGRDATATKALEVF